MTANIHSMKTLYLTRSLKALLLVTGSLLLSANALVSQSLLVNYLQDTHVATPSNLADGISASNISGKQTGVTGFSSAAGNAYWLLNGNTSAATPLAQTREDALAGSAYYEFTLTPDAGTELDLGLLTFGIGHASPARTLHVYTAATIEVNGQSWTVDAQFGEDPYYLGTSPGGAGALPATGSVNLSQLPLTGITEAVTFRIYAWYNLISGDAIPSGTAHSIRFGDVAVTSIPEPATAVLLTLLIPLGIWTMRRKMNSTQQS